MRLIGHLSDKAGAQAFSDYLLVEGVGNELEPEKEGWAIWVLDEENVSKARDLLAAFQNNPRDPRYQNRAAQAEVIKQQQQQDNASARKRYFDRDNVFRSPTSYRMGPLTLSLVISCVIIYGFIKWGRRLDLLEALSITAYGTGSPSGLPEVMHGQFWRLITPAFLHFSELHLIADMIWLLDLGSMIESRLNSGRLAILVLVIAAFSNFAQYYLVGPAFGGMSGVVYGLLGYIWIKGKFDPASGLFLHGQTVAMMLIWFVLCLVHIIPNVANAAHGGGLLLGVVWGYASSLWSKRRPV